MAANDTPPLISAVFDENIVECRRLIDTGEANVNGDRSQFGNTALHIASCCGHLEIIQLLLCQGADISFRNLFGRTALDMASSSYGRLKVADCLRKWPWTMAIIALQEIGMYKYLDLSSIEDLGHYLGNQ